MIASEAGGRPLASSNPTRMRHKVLLLGNHRHAVAAVRSLGAAGHHVIMGLAEQSGYAERSRYTAEAWPHPMPQANEAQFVEALLAFLSDRRDVGWVFPMGDMESLIIARHFERVRALAGVVMPAPQVVEICQDKEAMLRLATKLGVPHTGCTQATDLPGLVAGAEAAGFPCIVKPARSPARLFGRKAVICATPVELRARFPVWPEFHEALLVERYATGLRHNIHFAAAGGRLVRHVEGVTLRTDSIDGTGLNTEGVSVAPSPVLTDYTERMTRHLAYTGVGFSQFIVDTTSGAVCFLELNPRLPVNTSFGMRCGLDLPALALALAGGGPLPAGEFRSPVGIRYAWSSGDLEAWLLAVHAREVTAGGAVRWLGRIARALLTADFHASWRWDDPGPTFAHYAARLAVPLRRRLGQRNPTATAG